MIPDDVEALALADAVGALDADERRELSALLETLAPEARAEVARLYDTAAVVAGSVDEVEPPPHVRDRVMAAARTPGRYTLPASNDDWFDTPFAGIRGRVLAVDKAKGIATMLLRAAPGAVYPSHRHHGSEECYVLSGSLVIDGRTLRAGDFHHADADSDHGEIMTVEGVEVMIVGAVEDYLPGH
jgi:anti-sigma factor ChrR (cupin superfamily)